MIVEIISTVAIAVPFYLAYRDIKSYLNKVTSRVDLISSNLANPKTRGAWGEEIARNCLDKIGLKEGIDYFEQKTTEDGKRPDFTFNVLPGLVCNMDSKFPLTNFLRFCEAEEVNKRLGKVSRNSGQSEALAYKQAFLKDVKDRIKEVSSKGYIDPLNGTTDFAICFIPNEQLIEFITTEEVGFADFCIEKKVVLCSPWTLYSLISLFGVVRRTTQLSDNSVEIVKQINNFKKQWNEFKGAAGAVHKKMESVYSELDNLDGVRTRQLDNSFKKLGI